MEFSEHLESLALCYDMLKDPFRAKVFRSGKGKAVEAERIEFEKTNTSERLKSLEKGLDKSIKTFKKVFGVGPVTAMKWYEEGCRSLDDAKKLKNLTDAQKLGLEYFDDLQFRIERKEMEEWDRVLDIEGKTIVGSYRRGLNSSGDIDVLVKSEDISLDKMKSIVKKLEKYSVGSLAMGPRKYMGLVRLFDKVRRIDIRLFTEKEYPFALLYNTGSQEHNIKMRLIAQEKGLRLNEYSLGDHIVTDEKEIFHLLGMEYIKPELR